jgi:transposase
LVLILRNTFFRYTALTVPVVGALSVIRRAKQLGYTRRPWLARLLERRSTKVDAVALANKIARIAWAMMAHGTYYHKPQTQAV